jgi:hypothetical protein
MRTSSFRLSVRPVGSALDHSRRRRASLIGSPARRYMRAGVDSAPCISSSSDLYCARGFCHHGLPRRPVPDSSSTASSACACDQRRRALVPSHGGSYSCLTWSPHRNLLSMSSSWGRTKSPRREGRVLSFLESAPAFHGSPLLSCPRGGIGVDHRASRRPPHNRPDFCGRAARARRHPGSHQGRRESRCVYVSLFSLELPLFMGLVPVHVQQFLSVGQIENRFQAGRRITWTKQLTNERKYTDETTESFFLSNRFFDLWMAWWVIFINLRGSY